MVAENWMRAADGDREETVEILRQAYAEGRLGPAELDERTDTAFRARTIGELRGVIADIPPWGSFAGLPSDQPWRLETPCQPRRPTVGGSLRVSLLMLLATLVCIVVGAAIRNTAVITLALLAGVVAASRSRG